MCGAIVTGGSWGAEAEKCTPLRSILVGPPAKAWLVSRSSKKSAATMSMALDATHGGSRLPCPRAADESPPQLQGVAPQARSEEHTSELQVTNAHIVCLLLLEKK